MPEIEIKLIETRFERDKIGPNILQPKYINSKNAEKINICIRQLTWLKVLFQYFQLKYLQQ